MMSPDEPYPDRAACGVADRLRALVLFVTGRTMMTAAGVRGQLQRFTARMERDFCPSDNEFTDKVVEFEAREQDGRAALWLAGEPQPFEETDRLAGFLLSIGVRRMEMDANLECNQVNDVIEALWGIRGVLRKHRPGLLGRLFAYEELANDFLGPAGLNISCATAWLVREGGLLRVKYTYCRTAFSRAVERIKRGNTLFRDHRAFFRAAPRLGLLFAGLVALPLALRLVLIDHPAAWIAIDALVIVAVGFTVFILLETLGSLEYDKEHQQNEMARSNRLLTEAYDKIQRDVSTARKIQTALLPPPGHQPFPDKLRTAFWYQPEMAVGGDYFDLRRIDDKRLGILIVDVSGHGMSAAFVTGLVKMTLELGGSAREDPAVFLNAVNDALSRFTPADSFATVAYLTYNTVDRRLRFANAGHAPRPTILRADGQLFCLEEPAGFPVGVVDDVRYEDGETTLEAGDRLVLATDGISEAMNGKKEVWGSDAFTEFLRSHALDDAETLCEHLRQAVRNHEGDAAPNDDQTAAVIEVKPA